MKHPHSFSSRQAAWQAWCMWSAILVLLALAGSLPAPCDARRRAWITLFAISLATWFLLLRRQRGIVPAANYHSVSAHRDWLGLPELSISPALLDAQLCFLSRAGYQTLFISETADILEGRIPKPRRCVALTFDDGYADAWIAVYPLLARHGMKGTVFVTTDFIDPRRGIRPAINEKPAIEDWAGYLTETEIKTMIGSGRIEIQPHGRTHDRCFVSDTIRRFITPSHPDIWLYWHRHPEHKADWWQQPDLAGDLCGHPLFADGPALASRAYHPDPEACRHMTEWTRNQGPALFSRPDWAECLDAEWRNFRQLSAELSRIETETEFAARVEDELRTSQAILRERFAIKADILCWPQNEFCEQGEDIARRVGYRATVSNRHKTINHPRQVPPGRITRFHVIEEPFGAKAVRANLLVFIMRLYFMEGMYILLPLLCLINQLQKSGLRKKRSPGNCQNPPSIW